MIHEDIELTALQYVLKVLDGKVYYSSSWFEVSGKVGDRAPLIVNKLL